MFGRRPDAICKSYNVKRYDVACVVVMRSDECVTACLVNKRTVSSWIRGSPTCSGQSRKSGPAC